MVNCCGVPAPVMSSPTDVWFIHLGVITYYTNRIILFWYLYYLDPLSAHVILWNYSVLLTIQTVPHYSIGCKYGPNRLCNTWMTQCKNRIPEYTYWPDQNSGNVKILRIYVANKIWSGSVENNGVYKMWG